MVRLAIVFALLGLAACQEAGMPAGALRTPGAPSPLASGEETLTTAGTSSSLARSAASPEVPWKADLDWAVTGLEWPEGQPPFSGVTSLFNGRCSQPSDYVIAAGFEGEATHAGRFTGNGSHCTQLHLTPGGPGAVTYSDGRGTLTAADGSTLRLRWDGGTSGLDPATGETWFKDHFTFVGGTGRFEGATGGGVEGGRFADFMALLAGTPAPMTMEGTISYGRGR